MPYFYPILPGDGDSTLRHLQWNEYLCKRQFSWLTGLRIPLECLYNTNGSQPVFPMQDLLHVIKKLCTSVKRMETRCMMLGVDPKREMELSVWWDFIYEFIGRNPKLLIHCRLSAVLLTDKQDHLYLQTSAVYSSISLRQDTLPWVCTSSVCSS